MCKDGFSLNAGRIQSSSPAFHFASEISTVLSADAASLQKTLSQLDIMDPMTKHGTRNGHGGKRPRSGRKLGSRNLSTIRKLASKELELDTLSDGEFSALCAAASPVILEALISIAISKDPKVSGAAKVGASTAILAYAYGKPRQRPQAALPGDADWEKCSRNNPARRC